MKIRNQQGFTIIEVLIAIIMLTIGVLALASSSGAVTRSRPRRSWSCR